MKSEMFFKTFYSRQDNFLIGIQNLIFRFSSLPKLLLEVFIRKNFGERYFRLSAAITAFFIFSFFPLFFARLFTFTGAHFGQRRHVMDSFWSTNGAYYLFLLAFLYMSFKRWQEVRRNPSVFDFAKFSLYNGDMDERFYNIKLAGSPVNKRQIEIFCEPALFLIIGLVLWFFGQSLGVLLVICSIFYHGNHAYMYRKGDEYIMDIIDRMLANRSLEDVMVYNKPSSSGFDFRAQRPNSEEMRQDLYEGIKEEFEQAATVR